MVGKHDWRLTNQEEYLKEVALQWKKYTPYRAGWEHDHCEFCWSEFSEDDKPDILHEGYTTEDNYRWICKLCYEDFKKMYHWKTM